MENFDKVRSYVFNFDNYGDLEVDCYLANGKSFRLWDSDELKFAFSLFWNTVVKNNCSYDEVIKKLSANEDNK